MSWLISVIDIFHLRIMRRRICSDMMIRNHCKFKMHVLTFDVSGFNVKLLNLSNVIRIVGHVIFIIFCGVLFFRSEWWNLTKCSLFLWPWNLLHQEPQCVKCGSFFTMYYGVRQISKLWYITKHCLRTFWELFYVK